MRGRVVAHSGLANRGVDYGVDFIADAEGAPPSRVSCGGWGLHDNLMRAHSLHRVIAASHFGDDGVVIVGVKPSAIADLSARFGVEGSVVENDFAGVSGLEFLRALAGFEDGEDFAAVRTRLPIAF